MKKLILTTIILSTISTPLFAGMYEDQALRNQDEMLRIMKQQERDRQDQVHRDKLDRLINGGHYSY